MLSLSRIRCLHEGHSELPLTVLPFGRRQATTFRKLPSDAFNVTYVVEGETRLDITRSAKMANVFDMYYDRYGKDCVQKIDYGHGTINPGQWGYKAPEKKRKRKG